MKKTQSFMLATLLCVSSFNRAASSAPPGVPTAPQVGVARSGPILSGLGSKIDLSKLLDEYGGAFDQSRLDGKYVMLIFGTPYETVTCTNSFMHFDELDLQLERYCPDAADIVPVFVAPYAKDSGKNDNSIRAAQKRDFVVLRHNLEIVEEVGAAYRARYWKKDQYGDPQSHSALIYVLDDEGRNIFRLNANTQLSHLVADVQRELENGGFECN